MVSKTKLCKVQHLFTLFFRVDPPTFYPTLEEFSNLTKYVEYMESQGAHRYNFCTHYITRKKKTSGREFARLFHQKNGFHGGRATTLLI